MHKKWCTYVTVYSGDKLPPFYIGFVKTDRFKNEPYYGSVKSRKWKELWKSELRDNPHLFKRKITASFDTMKEAREREKEIINHFEAHKSPLFVNLSNGGNEHFHGGSCAPITEEDREKRRQNSLRFWNSVEGKNLRKEKSKFFSNIERNEKWRKNIGESTKKRDDIKELGRKLGKANIGRKQTEEELKRRSLTRRKGPNSEDHNKKISLNSSSKKGGKFINPEGVEISYDAFGDFCKSINIGRREMRKLRDGHIDEYKGWRRSV